MLGSMVGGLLLSFGWELSTVFMVAAVPAFVAGAAFADLGLTSRHERGLRKNN